MQKDILVIVGVPLLLWGLAFLVGLSVRPAALPEVVVWLAARALLEAGAEPAVQGAPEVWLAAQDVAARVELAEPEVAWALPAVGLVWFGVGRAGFAAAPVCFAERLVWSGVGPGAGPGVDWAWLPVGRVSSVVDPV